MTPTYAKGDGSLPDPTQRQRIDAALHQAVQDILGTDGSGMCWLYAMAGARMLNVLEDRTTYMVQAGSLQIQVCLDGRGFMFDAEQDGVTRRGYHAWIMRLHRTAAAKPESVAGGSLLALGGGRGVEVVDFASRHYRTFAEQRGLPWEMPETPPYLWCWLNELAARCVYLQCVPRAVQEMLTLQPTHLAEATADRALALYRLTTFAPLSRQQRRALERRYPR
jgi:hypothetical protein